MRESRQQRRTGGTVLLYLALSFFALTMVLPLLWMVSTSVKEPGVPYTSFLPGTPTLSHYVETLETTRFARYYFNSLFVTIVITVGQLTTSVLSGYAFARLEFPGRDKIFLAYLATLMIPTAVTMVPLFTLLTSVPTALNDFFGTSYFTDEQYFFGRWFAGTPIGADSYFALIAPMLFNPFGTFLLRQFFLGIPKSLDEAAMLDGCGKFGILIHVILPLSKPALATLGIFVFMAAWSEFLWPLIMTNAEEMRVLPVGLASFMGEYTTDWSLLMAAATMMLVPMIVLFVFCQRFFVQGIQLGAVKG